jgi:hypothetical protein
MAYGVAYAAKLSIFAACTIALKTNGFYAANVSGERALCRVRATAGLE